MVLTVLIFASIGTYLILSSKASPTIAADFNNDGTVNIFDLSILASNWNRTNATNLTGDANNDGTVNIFDLSILASQWGQTASPSPTPTPGSYAITSISTSHALAGSTITITGNGFGSVQGTSFVTFGERVNPVGVAPVSRQATVSSWSDTSITVTVPSMAPGLASVPGTHHPVYVTVNGTMTNSMDFYMDPVTTLDASSPLSAWQAMFPGSVITKKNVTYTNTPGSKHSSYATTVTVDSTNGPHPYAGNYIASNMHDILIKDANFVNTSPTINGNAAGVITIGLDWQGRTSNIYSLTFQNCVINNNTNPGSDTTGVNGVKSYFTDDPGRNGDWTFSDCSFGTPNSPGGSFLRMSLEVNEDDNMYNNYTFNIRVTGSDFEPPACEPISFNNRRRGPMRQYLIDNSVIKGAGATEVGVSPWGGSVFESSGYGLTIDNVDAWAWNGTLFNFEGTDEVTHSNYYFHQLRADMTHHYLTGLVDGGSVVYGGYLVNHAILDECDINMGDNSLKLRTFTWLGGGESPGWIGNSYWDMSTSYIHGITTDAPNPNSAIDYWRNTWNAADPVATYGYNIATNTDAQHNIYPHLGVRP